jgi:hypothetical protein
VGSMVERSMAADGRSFNRVEPAKQRVGAQCARRRAAQRARNGAAWRGASEQGSLAVRAMVRDGGLMAEGHGRRGDQRSGVAQRGGAQDGAAWHSTAWWSVVERSVEHTYAEARGSMLRRTLARA